MVHELELKLTFGPRPKILVIGDIMMDKHVHCEVLGLSPEDDLTPKVRVAKERASLGGAANTAVNLQTLGADVTLLGIIGKDTPGLWVLDQLRKHNIIAEGFQHPTRPTTVKTRYLTPRGRHIIRIDHEEDRQSKLFLQWLKGVKLPSVAAIVVSDYAKGLVSPDVMDMLRKSNDCPIVVDPKRPLEAYGKIFAATPNHNEFERCLDPDNLCSYQGADWIVVTLGSKGCDLIDKVKLSSERIPTRAREVGDPTGCGDSFVAAFAYAIVKGFSTKDACRIGNAAGAVKYDHRGVYAVSVRELVSEMAKGVGA